MEHKRTAAQDELCPEMVRSAADFQSEDAQGNQQD